MLARLPLALLAALVAVAIGCNDPKNDSPAGDDDDDDGTTWAPIITGDWTLDPNSELTNDLHAIQLDRDYYIRAIRPIAPPGTHHTLLAKNIVATDIIYASGLGTEEIVFPPGVALHLSAGETLYLQLHLFNVEATPLTGLSGIEILEMPAEDVLYEADVFLPGPRDLALPPSQVSTVTDTCNVTSEMNLFAVIPHMHQLGTHLRLAATVSGVTTTLHDQSYSFSNQQVAEFASPITVASGDSLEIECTWNNTTGATVGWGESTDTEMCFAILFRWPAQGQEFCTLFP